MFEQKTEYKAEINFENFTISVAKITIFINDGIELSRSIHRTGFVPGDVELVKAEMNMDDSAPFIIFVNAMWTAQVIQNYLDYIASLQNL